MPHDQTQPKAEAEVAATENPSSMSIWKNRTFEVSCRTKNFQHVNWICVQFFIIDEHIALCGKRDKKEIGPQQALMPSFHCCQTVQVTHLTTVVRRHILHLLQLPLFL